MKKLTAVLLILAIMLTSTACSSIMSDFVRDNLGDDAADSFDKQMEQNRQELDEAGKELGGLIGDQVDDAWQSMKDQFQDQLDNYLESIAPSLPDQEQLKAEWEAMLQATPGNIKDENGYTEHYQKKFSPGQCTWYAYGRFYEDTGIELSMTEYTDAKLWLNKCNDDRVNVIRDPYAIVPNSIAVDHKTTNSNHAGHVLYVEHVTYDENGTPVEVYFTECNWDSNETFNPGVDGIVKKLSFKNFIKRGEHAILGYIAAK